MAAADYFLYVVVFIAGVVVGRMAMAIQYSMMKKAAKEKKL